MREVQAAAVASDSAGLDEALGRLRHELGQHIDAERRDHEELPGVVKHALGAGQERLLSLVDALDSAACETGRRPCVVRLAELAALLRRQAWSEQRATHRVHRRIADGQDHG